MASKLGSLAPPIGFSPTSMNPKTAICTRRRIHWCFQKQQIVRVLSDCVVVVRAASGSGPNSAEPTSPANSRDSLPSPTPTPQDDLTYVLKLAAGSVLGAALIKYGSAIVPDITRPNISLALLMISAPAAIAVLLLFNSSREE